MILEVDMGNTRLKWRLRDQEKVVTQGAIGIEDPLDLLADKFGAYCKLISLVAVASVVGDLLEEKFTDWSLANTRLHPVFVRTGASCGSVRNGYREYQTLGVDRWLGMLAAYRLIDGACVVVSCGTAVTVDLIARDGQHLGGFIAPGLNLMLDSLVSRTRKINLKSEVPEFTLLPASATSDAVYSACTAMVTGLIDNGVQQLRKHDQYTEPQILFTGGDAHKFLSFYPQARLIPDLVMDGLACVLDYPQHLE